MILDMRKKGGRALRDSPLLKGLPVIGRGKFASVYDRGKTVMKLTADAHSYDFLRLKAKGNPVFPRVVTDHGMVGEVGGIPVFLLEMEKLKPVEKESFGARFADRFIRQYAAAYPALGAQYSNSWCSVEALCRMSELESFPLRLRRGLLDLAEFMAPRGCVADFHLQNFMMRGEQVVLNDPIADHYALF